VLTAKAAARASDNGNLAVETDVRHVHLPMVQMR
jgi:hypothetical protein